MSATNTKLAEVVKNFNGTFGYDLRLPMDAQTLESAASIAELRGQPVLAAGLRAGVAQVMEVVK